MAHDEIYTHGGPESVDGTFYNHPATPFANDEVREAIGADSSIESVSPGIEVSANMADFILTGELFGSTDSEEES
jgi:hypothetical protein